MLVKIAFRDYFDIFFVRVKKETQREFNEQLQYVIRTLKIFYAFRYDQIGYFLALINTAMQYMKNKLEKLSNLYDYHLCSISSYIFQPNSKTVKFFIH